ncbi:MAG: AlpA family phage regulatory protein [Smithellaceae bacterium]
MITEIENTGRRVIRKRELFKMIPLSDATIWRMERKGEFPKRFTLGGRAVGWFADEIDEWLDAKAIKRDEKDVFQLRG